MRFKQWLKLQEAGTGTNMVATVHMPTFPLVRRGCTGKEEKSGLCGLSGRLLTMKTGNSR